MAIKKTKDLIDYARNFHNELGRYYHDLADHTEKERLKLLLDYVSRHEKHFEESLNQYEESASKKITNYWLQNTPELPEVGSLLNFEIDQDTTIDDIVALAIRFDNKLIEIYKSLAHSADSEDIRNVFKKLLEMEEREKTKLVRQAMRLNEL